MDSIEVVGATLRELQKLNQLPEPMSLLCDADDKYKDGERFMKTLRSVSLF